MKRKQCCPILLLVSLLLSSCGTTATGQITEVATVMETVTTAEMEASDQTVCKQTPVRIAILDSGISTAAINPESLERGLNRIKPLSDTEDTIGHGTAVASIIVGSEAAGVEGICPQAVLIPLVYCTADYLGRTENADAALVGEMIREAVDTFHCDIINISSASTTDDSSLREAVEYALKQGVIVITCAGNANLTAPDNIYYPGAYDGVICVGSVNEEGQVSDFSQRGDDIDFVAPGEELPAAAMEGERTSVTGTSYAAAYVTGIVARILTEQPDLRERSENLSAIVLEQLKQRAEDICEPGWDEDSGWGALKR